MRTNVRPSSQQRPDPVSANVKDFDADLGSSSGSSRSLDCQPTLQTIKTLEASSQFDPGGDGALIVAVNGTPPCRS